MPASDHNGSLSRMGDCALECLFNFTLRELGDFLWQGLFAELMDTDNVVQMAHSRRVFYVTPVIIPASVENVGLEHVENTVCKVCVGACQRTSHPSLMLQTVASERKTSNVGSYYSGTKQRLRITLRTALSSRIHGPCCATFAHCVWIETAFMNEIPSVSVGLSAPHPSTQITHCSSSANLGRLNYKCLTQFLGDKM